MRGWYTSRALQDSKTLNLGNTKVTDAGLVHFSRLTELRSLDLSYTTVSGAGWGEHQRVIYSSHWIWVAPG